MTHAHTELVSGSVRALHQHKVLDLFAGPGGWDEGVRALGLRPLGIEWDTAAVETAQAAGHWRYQADIATLDPRDFTGTRGLIASPPCQGFSAAGKGRGRADSALLLAAIPDMLRRDVRPELHEQMTDDRSVLVLEPLRWALALTPSWLAWEQVPAVLPIWEACADVLRSVGYSVATGVLSAEQYGVPQTRKRAILVARAPWLVKVLGPVQLPTPTHSRYYVRTPQRLDEGVPAWVSMAEALGWGMTERPSMTVTGGGASTGGAEPFGNAARQGMAREADAGRWAMRSSAMTNATVRTIDRPSPTITAGHDRAERVWVMCSASAPAQETAGSSGQRVSVAEASVLQSFPADYPWRGTKTAQYRQVGDAVPPLLARAVVAQVAGLAVQAEPLSGTVTA